MSKSISFVLLVFSSMLLSAQCEDYNIILRSQADVDNFPKLVNYCNEFNTCEIRASDSSDIVNLDSLYIITKIKNRFSISGGNIKSIDGLKNLEYVGSFSLFKLSVDLLFPKLDTVGSLSITFEKDDTNLEGFSSIKEMNAIFLTGNINLKGLNTFTCSREDRFRLSISNNSEQNNLIDILPSNISEIELAMILENSKNLNTNGIGDVNIELLGLDNIYVDYVDFGGFESTNYIKRLRINSYNEKPFNLNAFPNLKTVEILEIQQNKDEINIFEIAPALNEVRQNISIDRNTILSDISWLENFVLPSDTSYIYYNEPRKSSKLYFFNNPNLNACDLDFVCRALERYPDSVYLERNGEFCTKIKVLDACKKVNVNETSITKMGIYPNPTTSLLTIDGLTDAAIVDIYNLQGTNMGTQPLDENKTIDIGHIPAGMYILYIQTKDRRERHKIIKMD